MPSTSLVKVFIQRSLPYYERADDQTGDDGLTDYAFRTMKRPFTFQAGDPIRSVMLNCAKEWRDRFHVYFPSEQTVRATHEEPDKTAGTICFNSNYWNKLGFPRRVMRDCEGKRDVLMHNKVRHSQRSTPNPPPTKFPLTQSSSSSSPQANQLFSTTKQSAKAGPTSAAPTSPKAPGAASCKTAKPSNPN